MAKHIQQASHVLLPGKGKDRRSNSGGALSGTKGIAAGAGAAVLVPLMVKNAGRLTDRIDVPDPRGIVEEAKHAVGHEVRHRVLDAVPGGSLLEKISGGSDHGGGEALKGLFSSTLPFGGDDDDSDGQQPRGVGKGRRMPVQQSVDIGAPIEQVYNRWIQFEEWPNFMHRVVRVSQDDETTVNFQARIWGLSKEFKAEIDTQRPMDRVKWHVTEGMTHTGVVTFHELGPNLTRVLLGIDVEPGGMIEKLARGLRHVKRAARGDLHRFKAFVEMSDEDVEGWQGTIEDGEVVNSGRGRRSSNSAASRRRGNGHAGSSSRQTQSGSRQSTRSQSRSRSGHDS